MSLQPLKTHKSFEGQTQFWEHESRVTKTKMKFSTFIPQGTVKGCLIWLSGLTCTDENFITKAGAQRRLAEKGLMVICPDTSPRGLNLPGEHEADDFGSGAGFYLNATTAGYKDHYRMFDYINEELYSLIQSQFSIRADQISISGHSMGGHGALILGLRHPEKYRSVSAFSPIVHPTQVPWGQKAFKGYLGEDQSAWSSYDATELVRQGRKHPKTILIDQGTKDPFLEKQLRTVDFANAAEGAKLSVKINMREGYDHSYYFIATFIDSHLDFHASQL